MKNLENKLAEGQDTTIKSLKRRSLASATNHCNQINYKILETSWKSQAGKIDIIALDEDQLVFIDVITVKTADNGFPNDDTEHIDRTTHEMIALDYIATHDNINNISFRFDVIGVIPIRDRAMLRHHVNALGAA